MSASPSRPIRIATRASRLALWQAGHVADLLRSAAPDTTIEIVHVTTMGDRDQLEPLSSLGGVGVFTREVQRAVLDGRADVAVHSLKDLPTESAAGLHLAAVPPRGDTADALVLPASCAEPFDLDSLPARARIGTSSLRRQAQLRHRRPDLETADVRGNVETRVRKLDAGDYDALVLAVAGLRRLELTPRISRVLEPPLMYPAVGQGALGIECREDDSSLRALLAKTDDRATHQAVIAERSLLARLRAGCHAPVGVTTRLEMGELVLEGVVLSADGRQRVQALGRAPASDAEALGRTVADELLSQGADRLIAR